MGAGGRARGVVGGRSGELAGGVARVGQQHRASAGVQTVTIDRGGRTPQPVVADPVPTARCWPNSR